MSMKIKSTAERMLDKALEERGLKKGEKPKKKKVKKK